MTFPNQDPPQTETPAPDQEPVQPVTPAFVTKEQLDAEIARLNKQYENKMNAFFRGTESSNTKFQHRVDQRVAALEGAAQKQGVTLTASQKQQITDQVTIEELRSTAQPGNPEEPPGEPDPEAEQVNNAAAELIKQSKVSFEEGDPEIAIIDKAAENGTKEEYLAAVKEAITQKKARLANPKWQQPVRAPAGGAPGAIGGSPNGNPIANITDPDELYAIAKQQGKF